jgi:hypothetical protein
MLMLRWKEGKSSLTRRRKVFNVPKPQLWTSTTPSSFKVQSNTDEDGKPA